MSYRFADPNGPLINLLGTETAAGGSVQFYNYGTTTPKPTYADRDLTIPNPNPVPIDVSGRLSVEVWLDGEYTALLRDQDTNVVWTRDVVPEVPPGATVPDPSGQAGKVLKSNGSILVYDDPREVPDGTGLPGYMLVMNSDASAPIWQPQPEAPEAPDPEIVVTAGSFRGGVSGNTTKYLRQWGTATAPASGTPTTTVTVTFPTPFAVGVVPHISIIIHGNTQPGGPVVWNLTSPPTNTGFTAQLDVAEYNSGNANVVNPIPIGWSADGTVTVT